VIEAKKPVVVEAKKQVVVESKDRSLRIKNA